MSKVKKQKKKTPAQIRNLRHLREIAYIITKDRRLTLVFDKDALTSAYFPIFNKIVIAENILPEVVKKYPLLRQKLLDGVVIHESGHRLLTHPLEAEYKNFEQRVKFPNLAHTCMNIIEDKRINRFMKSRYRFDYGKRLVFRHDVIRDGIETDMEFLMKKGELPKGKKGQICKVIALVGALGNKGLYDANIQKFITKYFDSDMKKDLKTMLAELEKVKFKRVRRDIINTYKKLYFILERYATSDLENFNVLLPSEIRGGTLGKRISDAMRKKLEAEGIELQEEAEKEKQKEKEGETESGASAGIGTGDEIPSPPSNYDHYEEIVVRNKPEIERLLRKLKQIMTPQIVRADFQKRGRIMRGILAKAYVRSLRRDVSRIYHHTDLRFEKQRVAIQVLVDFSASMDKNVAEDIVTILNEVWGNWLEDNSYGISVFGENRQKIKTMYETFDKTRARIGGINVNSWGTMLETSLQDSLRMFNGVNEDRQKILIVCSDFALGDESESLKVFDQILKNDVRLIMVKLCSYRRLPSLEDNRKVEVIECKNIQDLPEIFVDAYMRASREE